MLVRCVCSGGLRFPAPRLGIAPRVVAQSSFLSLFVALRFSLGSAVLRETNPSPKAMRSAVVLLLLPAAIATGAGDYGNYISKYGDFHQRLSGFGDFAKGRRLLRPEAA